MSNPIVNICHSRSMNRDPKTKEARFTVVYENGDREVKLLSEIKNTQVIDDIVCDFYLKAREYPHVKRMCLTCGLQINPVEDRFLIFCNSKTKRCKKMKKKYGVKMLEKIVQKIESDANKFEEETMELKYEHKTLLQDGNSFMNKTIVKDTFKRFREECDDLDDGKKRLHSVIALYNLQNEDCDDYLYVAFKKDSYNNEKILSQLNTIWKRLGGDDAFNVKYSYHDGRQDFEDVGDFKEWYKTVWEQDPRQLKERYETESVSARQ